MSNFQLRLNTFERNFPIDLTEEEATQIEVAYSTLVAAVELEELFDVVVEDYIELETSILESAVNHMVRGFGMSSNFDWTRRLFNRRLMHLLTTARSYLDSAPKLGDKLHDYKSQFKCEVKRLAAQQYDSKLGYRVLEALRNSAQHGGFPLHGFTVGGTRVAGKAGQSRLAFYAIPTFTVNELRKDGKFKKVILDELENLGSKFDIRPFVREYLEGLSNIQVGLRAFASERIDRSEKLVKDAIASWRKENARGNVVGLALVELGARGTFRVKRQLSQRPLDALTQFRNSNSNLANLSSRYISSSAEFADEESSSE